MEQVTTHDSLLSWLILHLAPGFGAPSWRNMLANSLTPQQICAFDKKALFNLGLKAQTIQAILHPDRKKLDQTFNWLQEKGHFIVTLGDKDYPPLLATIPDPPPLLYVKGNLSVLRAPQLAIVGSRNPTCTGSELAHHFARQLSFSGLLITSGLAAGIDSAAHQGAISANSPTIAVFGCGIEEIYPKKNMNLAAKISENGAIISEFTLRAPPARYQFPQRNRIISGLCLGTLVIEAARKSGSLITAYLAAEQGREVFALPGSILNPMSVGCLELIQNGAKLTASVADIMEELRLHCAPPQANFPLNLNLESSNLDIDEVKLIECMGFDITYFDQMTDRTGFSPQKVSAMLCNLKLNGYIREEMGGYSRVTTAPPLMGIVTSIK